MLRKNMIKIENYFEIFLILFLLLSFFYLIKGFIFSLLLAATLVFLFYKPYKKLANKIKNETISSLFMLFLVLTCILLPTYLIGLSLVNESKNVFESGDKLINILNNNKLCNFFICSKIKNNLDFIDINIENTLNKISNYILNSYKEIFNSIVRIFINFFIFILSFFFLLKDGDKLTVYIKRIIPMKNEYKNALFLKFKQVTLAVFLDSILVSLIQGVLMGIGFWIFGISSPIFWGIISAFFALLPMIGTGIIWLPIVIYFVLVENYITALLFLLYSGIIVSLSDNVIRPILINKKVEVHPFLILLSLLGGIEAFGILGFFLGPIIISLLISVLQLYNLDFK